jgi:hypothetical protein
MTAGRMTVRRRGRAAIGETGRVSTTGRQQARERAAAERAETERRGRRRRRLVAALVVVAVVLVAVGVTAGVLLSGRAAGAGTAIAGRTSPPPWAAPVDVQQRARAAGLEMLTAEGEVLHIHEHLSVTVDGKPVQVPPLLGIDEAAKRISPIHTHDATGIIHVESPVVKTFRLGQVFAEWDVALGRGRVGVYRDGQDGDRVAVFVDRTAYTGDPARIVLGKRQDIDVVVTTDGSTPPAPRTAFSFPPGY